MALFIPPLINQNITLPNTSFVQSLNKYNETTEEIATSNQAIITENVTAKFVTGVQIGTIIKESKITKILVQLIPDYKTDTFSVRLLIEREKTSDSYFNDFSLRYSLQANDSSSNKTTSEETFYGDKQEKWLYSTNFSEPLSYSDLNSLSFVFWIDEIKNEYTFQLGKTDLYKTDLILNPEFQEYILKVQIGTEIDPSGTGRPILSPIKLKPYDIEQGKHNRNLVNVEMYSQDRPFKRIFFKPIKATNIPISKEAKKTHELSLNFIGDNYYQSDAERTIYTDQYSFYDLDLKETHLGAGANSQMGYVIPYNYDKDFFPSIEFEVNQFKKFKFTWTKKILKPYFDGDKGKIKIAFKNNIENPYLYSDEWIKIKSDFFDKPENIDITFDDLIKPVPKN